MRKSGAVRKSCHRLVYDKGSDKALRSLKVVVGYFYGKG